MTIQYIWHDCFIIRTSTFSLIFDYWCDPSSKTADEYSSDCPLFLDSIDKNLPVYVFVSHHHKDHFNPTVFQWVSHFKRIKFILSKDTYIRAKCYFNPNSLYTGKRRTSIESIIQLNNGDIFKDEFIETKAYPSTDTGNSYAITLKNNSSIFTIFHAGDLNAWTWRDESSIEEINTAIASYNKILDEINRDFTAFDLVFFPVDPRIGSGFREGAQIFMSRFQIGRFIPMHYALGTSHEQQQQFENLAADSTKFQMPNCKEYIPMKPYNCIDL